MANPMDEQRLRNYTPGIWNQYVIEVQRRVDLSDASIAHLDLSGRHFEQVDFQRADLEGCTFRNCKLSEAQFQGARMDNVIIEGSALYKACFQQADLDRAEITNCNMIQSNFSLAHAVEAKFIKCDMNRTNLDNSVLVQSQIIDSLINNANIRNAALHNASFQGTTLLRCDLTGANLYEVDLSTTRLYEVHGLRVNGTFVGTNPFSVGAGDPWSQLRGRYTGTMLIVNFLLLFAFVVPRFAELGALYFVHSVQTQALKTVEVSLEGAGMHFIDEPVVTSILNSMLESWTTWVSESWI